MLFAVKNTALSSVYAMKKKAYCAVCPQLVGIAKQATRATEQPIYGHNIQGRALPIFVWVLSIIRPKKKSVTPSKTLESAINVPMIPMLKPTVSVR